MSTQIEPAEALLGRTAYAVIRRSLRAVEGSEKECFRVKNLTDMEALALLQAWCSRAEDDNLSHVRVVVANDSSDVFPTEYRAEEGSTITSYRNNKDPLVYIETKVESDEQGLKNLFTLRDVNFLDGSFDTDDFNVPEVLVGIALGMESAERHAGSNLLTERLVTVVDGLRHGGAAVPVRKFAAFALAASRSLAQVQGSVEPGELDRLVGRNLTSLDLFDDEHWRRDPNSVRSSRRLSQNLLHAELASSQTADLDQDKLVEQCRRTVFRSVEGEELGQAEQERWRDLCADYCEHPRRETREQIPYWVFEQLFSRDLKGLKLGERVRQEIDHSAPHRLQELDALSVARGLDRRDRDDAQRFLEKESEDEAENALRDLLTKQTRRMVEKVAYPNPEGFDNPLLKIAHVAHAMREGMGTVEGSLILEMRLGRSADRGNPTIGLMAFLYGPTLSAVAEASQLSSDGFQLKVDPLFTTVSEPAGLIDDSDADPDEETPDALRWDPVPVDFALLREGDPDEIEVESALEWAPSSLDRLALLWLILCAEDRPGPTARLGIAQDMKFDTWVGEVISRTASLQSVVRGQMEQNVLEHSSIARLVSTKGAFEREARNSGLSSELLNDRFDTWDEILRECKDLFVPDGRADPHLTALLEHECIAGPTAASLIMLGSHPLRLRWLARYLRESERLAIKSLEGALPLNSQNDSMYLGWISGLSPHQQPAIHISRDRQLLLASGEAGLTEEFYPPAQASAASQSESISPQLISEIVNQVTAYLEAHPYKEDGLSILLVSPVGPRTAADLVTALRRGQWSDLRISVHLAAPKNLWESASKYFEEVPAENRMSAGNAIFPPLEFRLYDFGPEFEPEKIFADLQVDIAIVPQFFRDGIEIQENTEPVPDGEGAFDPLLDRPTFVYGGTKGGAISVSQRPRNPDLPLASWSSAVVRQHRLRPVAPQQPENMDFVELRINFQEAARLFAHLHECSHWVITLERYITREQIEQLDNRPEILTVRDRVGPGSMFTLIVSSNVGRRFIVNRLERKLAVLVEKSGGGGAVVNRALAERIYDETRAIAPRLALKAMGISRVTEEILGLAVGRRLLGARFPVSVERGFVAWISLDEHPEWFGGNSGTRADLCRISMEEVDAGLAVDIVILESKLRKGGYDPHGVEQVSATMSLFKDMMPVAPGEQELIDASLWRENVLSAIEAANSEAIEMLGDVLEEMDDRPHHIPVSMRNAFRDGNFMLRQLKGVYSICMYGGPPSQEGEEARDESGVIVIRSFAEQLLSLVSEDVGTEEMSPQAGVEHEAEREFEEQSGVTEPSVHPAEVKTRETGPAPEVGPIGQVDGSKPLVTLRGRLGRAELENRYQTIMNTYDEFGISVHKTERPDEQFVEGPATVLYRIRPGHGVDPKKIYERADALRLQLKLAEEQRIRFSIDAGYVTIDVPKDEADRYFVNAEDLWRDWTREPDALSVPLGEDRFGKPVILNFSSSNSPHLLIGGTTGSGKSEALNTILAGLTRHYAPEELRLLLVDPKGTELQEYETSEHLEGDIGWDEEEAIQLLNRAVAEMQRRYQLFREARTRSLPEYNAKAESDQRIPWWLIVLDEYADLTSDADVKKSIEDQLKRLAQKARAAGIHVVIATQKPSAEVISTNLRANLPAQLALRVKSGTESRVIMNEAGAETLNGIGDAFLKSEGRVVRVQCAKV
jgi:DNA segregation ATPase FtsK/SpoIIIE, S-DNA-T family